MEEETIKNDQEKGTIAGAVALIIGTSIGSGIPALPQKASPAVKRSTTISVCLISWCLVVLNSVLRCRESFQVQYHW